MALDGCGVFCKYVLFFFNAIFALVGFAFLGLGLWLRFSDNTRPFFGMEQLNSSAFVIGVTVLIVLGSVMLIVVVFGDYGACSGSRCALAVFGGLVSVLIVSTAAVGFFAFFKRNELGVQMGEFYGSLYLIYVASRDPGLGVSLTFIHNMLDCCGMTGISIVEAVRNTCPKSSGFLSGILMDSCPKIILNVFEAKAPLVLGIFLGTGALLLVALICSTTLARKIRQATAAPHYIILTQTSAVPMSVQPPLHDFTSTSQTDPVVFTPLTMANIPPVATIPVAQA